MQSCRQQFPALAREENGRPVVYFDGPAGTQVPQAVIDAMTDYLVRCNANHHGQFATSRESDDWLVAAHQAHADFLGVADPDEISFGQNMTSLTFAFSRALARTWQAGDQIVVTALDHDANITPWTLAARDAGVEVKFVPFKSDDYTLDMDAFGECLNEKTRLIAVGAASNATGGINPIKRDLPTGSCTERSSFCRCGALRTTRFNRRCRLGLRLPRLFHLQIFWAAHGRILGPPRVAGTTLEAYKVRPSSNELPGKWMTGTQSHESIVGGLACVDYLADLGRIISAEPNANRRAAMTIGDGGNSRV